MRNISIPIKEFHAAAARSRARQILEAVATIPEIDKSKALSDLAEKEDGLVNKHARDRESATPEEFLALQDKFNNEILDLTAQRANLSPVMTDEEKAAALAQIIAEDAIYQRSYGMQKLTTEDIAQRNADDQRMSEYTATEKYKDDRALAYPPITEQLDALWKSASAIPDLNPETADMLAKIEKVKADHPKPEDTNV